MKKLLYLLLLLLPVLSVAQSRYGVEGVPMCWTISGKDSSIVRYVLISSTGKPVKTVAYENAQGAVINVSGGVLRYGFCDCAGGLDSLPNASVTWSKLASPVKDSIRIGMNPKRDTNIYFTGNYNLGTAIDESIIQRRYRKINLSGMAAGSGTKVNLILPDGGSTMSDVDVTVFANEDTISVSSLVNDQIATKFKNVLPQKTNEYKCLIRSGGYSWRGSAWDSLGVGGGGSASIDTLYFSNDSLYVLSGGDTFTGKISELSEINASIEAVAASQGDVALNSRYVDYYIGDGRSASTEAFVSPSDANLAESFATDSTLVIPTYDGLPSVTHPSVVFMKNGWNGYKYWMAFTPYPSEPRENPSVIASNDGRNWVVPAGLTNPLDPTPPSGWNSDVDLTFKNDTLYLIWNQHVSNTNKKVFLRKSANGTTWTTKQQIMQLGYDIASPTMDFYKGKWRMWFVDVRTSGQHKIKYRSSETLSGLYNAVDQTCVITYPTAEHQTNVSLHIWHIEVKFDSIEDQFRAIFNYTQSGLGSPNNNGKLTYATTTDGVHFDVKDYIFNFPNSMYRSTMTRTSFADSCGAEFEMFYAPQWNICRTLVFLKPRVNTSTYAYDNLSDTLFHVYSLRYRLSRWKGLPVARVVRKTDGAIRDVYPNSANTGLQLASGVSLQSWAGSDSLFVSRLYDQKGGANFVAFVNPTTRPYLRPPGLTWPYTWAWQHFPTRNTAGISYYFKNTTIRGVTTAAQITSGVLWGSFASGYYFGFNAGNLTLLAGTNINYLAIPRPSVFTGVFGTAYIRQNRTVAVAGTTSGAAAINDRIVIGSRYSGATYSSFSDGIVPELVLWKLPPHSTEVDSVEIRQSLDYAYKVDSTLYDTYTATDGTALSTRTANTGQSYTVSDANWAVTSNQLGRSAAGSGLPTAVVNCGTTSGVIECTQVRGANGGSGPILRYVDQNNFVYLRIFNGTSLGLFRYVGGSLQTGSGVTIPLINSGQTFTWKVERIGNTFRVYTDGVLRMTLTETNFTSSTTVGFYATTSDTGVKWDALKVTPW